MNLIQIHLICEMLAKFSVVEIIQKYQVSLEKENFLLCSCTPRSGHIKLGSFMPQSQHSHATTEKKNAQKSVMQVQSCCLPT